MRTEDEIIEQIARITAEAKAAIDSGDSEGVPILRRMADFAYDLRPDFIALDDEERARVKIALRAFEAEYDRIREKLEVLIERIREGARR